MKTKQIVFTKLNTAELIETEYQAPAENEVTVRLLYSAISSGTERACITGQRMGSEEAENQIASFPRSIGYSSVGVVSAVGAGVTDVCIGERVAVAWGLHKQVLTLSHERVVKVPEAVSSEQAALTLISTFPLAAIRKTRLEIGESAMVMGLGILGQLAVAELRAAGAVPILAVDPTAERRELALRMGADAALDPTEADFCDKVKAITGGGVHVAIEVTGLGQGLIGALDCMKRFGRVALLGCTRSSDFKIDYYRKVHIPGITLIGAHTDVRPKNESYPAYWTHQDDMTAVLRMLGCGRLDFGKLITEIHVPEEAPQVYARLIAERTFPVGVLFDWTKME